MKNRDDIFAQPLAEIVDFRFDERVVGVFPDMINRSVPGYGTVVNTIGVWAEHFARPDTHIYDLGCSLGAVTLSIRRHIGRLRAKIIAVDNSPAMVSSMREILARDTGSAPVEIFCADLVGFPIENASMAVLNFTLQFVPPPQRDSVLKEIARGINPGGILILSEKMRFEDPAQDALLVDTYHAFKKANGYSELEISQKRTALEKVMIPESPETHANRLRAAGFSRVYPWFQCLNFSSLVAIK